MQKKVLINAKSLGVWVPVLLIVALLAFNSYLIGVNTACARKNRALLLQNDSVLSLNLTLINELQKMRKARPPEKN